MPRRRLRLKAIAIGFAAATVPLAPAVAFDHKEFCVTAQEVAAAMEQDIGVWVDRVTRNAGMVVSCESKRVDFKHFTYTPSAAMGAAWKERMSAGWSADYCSRALWLEAVSNGWSVTLSVWSSDGGHVTLVAQCR